MCWWWWWSVSCVEFGLHAKTKQAKISTQFHDAHLTFTDLIDSFIWSGGARKRKPEQQEQTKLPLKMHKHNNRHGHTYHGWCLLLRLIGYNFSTPKGIWTVQLGITYKDIIRHQGRSHTSKKISIQRLKAFYGWYKFKMLHLGEQSVTAQDKLSDFLGVIFIRPDYNDFFEGVYISSV